MLIRFTKGSAQKRSILKCIREDGSSTWTRIDPAIEFHDLAHYVVETELKFNKAFYGLVAAGFNIGDFELPRDQRPNELIPSNLPAEALQTEHIVNLLQLASDGQMSESDILKSLSTILEENNLPFPGKLSTKSLRSIQIRLKGVLLRWNRLEPAEVLELKF